MVKDETTPLVIEIAKSFVECLRDIDPQWDKGYLRILVQSSMCEAKGSYMKEADISIINTLKYKTLFHSLTDKGEALFALLEKEKGVMLLTIDSNFSYNITFEYEDMNRWGISKLDGGTGIPVGA